MKLRAVLAIVSALVCSAPVGAQGVSYADAYEFFCALFSIDPNAGLTTFLSTRIPVGGTAEGMGTAFTAVSDDSSYLEINPAGSSILEKTEFAFYHNNWIEDTRIESLAYSMRLGSFGLAIGGKWLYLPFTERDDMGARVTTGYYSEASGIANASYHFFPGYYFYGFSVGANLKLAYRAIPDYGDENGDIIPGSGAEQSGLAILADAGILTRFNFLKLYASRDKNFSIGAALRNFGPPVLGEPLPSSVTVGLAYSPLRPMLFSFDFTQPINLVDAAKSERAIWAVGYAMNVTSFWDIQAGLLIKGGNPRLSVGTTIRVNPLVTVINYTLDLTTRFTPLNRLSIEVRFDMGDMGRAELQRKVDDLYMRGLEAYAQGKIELAIELWKQVLALNPYFDPAREGLETAQAALELQRRVIEVQKLE